MQNITQRRFQHNYFSVASIREIYTQMNYIISIDVFVNIL